MLGTEELDARWRDGLQVLAAHLAASVPPGASDRVTHQMQKRARRRTLRTGTASVIALAAIIALVMTLSFGRNSATRVHVTPGAPQLVAHPMGVIADVHITALTDLKLAADVAQRGQKHVHVNPGSPIRLPRAGTYEVIVSGGAGHDIGFVELPDRDRVLLAGKGTQRFAVNLPRGAFTIDCSVPGHAAAGMLLHVIVG
jgi:hypothetical protein